MLTIRHDNFSGKRNDHYRKRRTPAKQWRSLIEQEYTNAPRVDVQGISCGIRRTFETDRPFRLIQPNGDSFTLLDVWLQSDGTLQVRQQMSKEILAILVETDAGLSPVCPAPSCPEAAPLTPYEEAAARHQAIEALLAEPLPAAERAAVLAERKVVQRQLSQASFEELYLDGLKSFRDGNTDSGLVGRVLKVVALERQLLRGNLSPQERTRIETDLLPFNRRAVAAYVKYRRRIGKEL